MDLFYVFWGNLRIFLGGGGTDILTLPNSASEYSRKCWTCVSAHPGRRGCPGAEGFRPKASPRSAAFGIARAETSEVDGRVKQLRMRITRRPKWIQTRATNTKWRFIHFRSLQCLHLPPLPEVSPLRLFKREKRGSDKSKERGGPKE